MNCRTKALVGACLAVTVAGGVSAQDWPQWRGANRDAKVTGFHAPQTWPPKLTQKWKVTVGDGVATPAFVNNQLFVFSRQDGNTVIRCLNAETGKEVWSKKYESDDAEGAAARFPVLGPRSSPTVASGKIVTLDTRDTLCCFDAASGNQLWRKDDIHSWPRFFASSSPIVVDGLCIAQLGGDRDGGIFAFDLATGNEKWKWTGDGPAYGSPALTTIDKTKIIIAPTAHHMVAVGASDGKLLWEMPYTQGRYNAASPMADGQTLIYAGPTKGITADKLVLKDGKLTTENLWKNPDNSVLYDTPVLKNGLLFGLSTLDSLFCVNASTGKTAWNAAVGKTSSAAPAAAPKAAAQTEGRRGRGGRGRRGGGGGGGYGSIVDAGDVLLAISPAAELIAFQPSEKAFVELARYKVADGSTYCYPVIIGSRIYIKDKNSVMLWTFD
jgi:outer membrane protein assembly factor BamB